jgi:hypothetical protein
MIEYTDTELITVRKSFDPVYFIDNYINVPNPRISGTVPFKLYSKQKAVIKGIQEFDHNLLLTSRQVGGSSLICALGLWEAIMHTNRRIVVLSDKWAGASELNHKTRVMFESLPEIFTRGFKIECFGKHTLEFSNGSKISFDSTTESSCHGINSNSLYCDNFAFVNHERAEWFFKSIAPSLANGSKATFVSCLNQAPNYFSQLWSEADQRLNTFNQMTLLWSEIKDEYSTKSV